jgi:hypothetical protein
LDPERRAQWEADAASRGTFEEFLRYYLGPARTVAVSSFLIETSAVSISDLGVDSYGEDPETALRAVIEENGFRLPTNDEWEVAMRAGVSTLFAWGDTWPDGAGPTHGDHTRRTSTFDAHMKANALGIVPRTNPYETEVVAERDWLRGGDGGVAICGGRPSPEAWYSFALAFQLPRELWGELVPETFEQAFARRTLSLL